MSEKNKQQQKQQKNFIENVDGNCLLRSEAQAKNKCRGKNVK